MKKLVEPNTLVLLYWCAYFGIVFLKHNNVCFFKVYYCGYWRDFILGVWGGGDALYINQR